MLQVMDIPLIKKTLSFFKEEEVIMEFSQGFENRVLVLAQGSNNKDLIIKLNEEHDFYLESEEKDLYKSTLEYKFLSESFNPIKDFNLLNIYRNQIINK